MIIPAFSNTENIPVDCTQEGAWSFSLSTLTITVPVPLMNEYHLKKVTTERFFLKNVLK